MYKVGFDNNKYIKMQSDNILKRISCFNKLYLEFGGKLFDDHHASRVLPGFEPDSKIKMLNAIKDRVEMMLVISAEHIEKNKVRGDLGITYYQDLMRLIDAFNEAGLYVGSVVITHYSKQPEAQRLKRKLEKLGIRVAYHYPIDNYPNDIDLILSKDGFGKNDYIENTRDIIVVTAPGPGSGKMATCLSQMYHDNLHGIKAGYAKFETFPIWNLPLNHPVNLAYEAATVDLNDINMIDPFHLSAYNEVAVNYNRDVEVFPVLNNKKECLGVIQLSDTINKHKKQVILVDHNEKEQSAEGLEEAEIVEIVDHHKIGTIGTREPINFRNMPVGCTSSIIYMLFKENRISIPKNIAGIMLGSIISDTLLFRSPTTTETDKEIAYNLSNLVEIDIEDFAHDMFKYGSSLKDKTVEDILFTDFKTFNLDNIKIGVGQINTVDIEELDNMKDELNILMEDFVIEQNYNLIMLFATDIIREGSYVYYNEKAREIIENAFNMENLYQGCFIPEIISRKKQIIPNIVNVLEEK